MANLRALYDTSGKLIIEDELGLYNGIDNIEAVDNKYSLDVAFKRKFTIAGAYDIAQVETATAAGTITTAGNATVTVTSALFEADEVVSVPVELDDDAAGIALAIRTALAANEVIAEHFNVSGATDKIILTAKVPAANDATLNIAIANDTCEGITPAATSANTTAGAIANKTIEINNVPQIGEKITINIYADFTVIKPTTLTFPASVIWLDGTEPTLETGKYYELEFYTVDGGTAWFGKLAATYNS